MNDDYHRLVLHFFSVDIEGFSYNSHHANFHKSFSIFSSLVPPPPEPVWSLDRRESSGDLFWRRDSSKVKFRYDVEIVEFIKDPAEHEQILVNGNLQNTFKNDPISHPIIVCATCICAIAVTILIPWFLIGSS